MISLFRLCFSPSPSGGVQHGGSYVQALLGSSAPPPFIYCCATLNPHQYIFSKFPLLVFNKFLFFKTLKFDKKKWFSPDTAELASLVVLKTRFAPLALLCLHVHLKSPLCFHARLQVLFWRFSIVHGCPLETRFDLCFYSSLYLTWSFYRILNFLGFYSNTGFTN